MLEDITKRIEELETQKAEKEAKLRQLKKDTHNKILSLNEEFKNAHAEDVPRLNRELSEAVQLENELRRREPRERLTPFLSVKDYNAIKAEANKEEEAIKEKHLEDITRTANAFLEAMDAYTAEAEEAENLKTRAGRLASTNGSGYSLGVYTLNEFSGQFGEEDVRARDMVFSYFEKRTAWLEEARKKAGKWA